MRGRGHKCNKNLRILPDRRQGIWEIAPSEQVTKKLVDQPEKT